MKKIFFAFILFLLSSFVVRAFGNEKENYVFSKIDHTQGLSNSAVICIFKDDSELMWFGTYDGVNCFDGKEMEVFRADPTNSKTLDNNVIYGIKQADGNNIWISTLLGVNRFSRDIRQVVANYRVSPGTYLCSNSRGNTWLVGHDSITYYNIFHNCFIGIEGPDITINDPESRSFVTDDGELWLFPDSDEMGDAYRIALNAFDQDTLSTRVQTYSSRFHHKPIKNIFYQNNASFFFIDSDNDLYMYDIGQHAKLRIRNMESLLQRYGHIIGVVPFYDDFIIAFRSNGLVRLNTAEAYREEMIDRNLRVFYLYKDSTQGILWVGVDGKGAMMYTKRHSIATNIMMSSLSPNFTRQVRSLMTDKYGGLWFGTKGDGLMHIKEYTSGISSGKTEIFSPERRQVAGTYTRNDTEFSVFSLKQSEYMDGFWIGSGAGGLFYFTFNDSQLRHAADPLRGQPDEIHEIYEASDTVLYVATAVSGFRKLTLDKSGGKISIKNQKQYHFFHQQQEISTFFAMMPEGDSILWLGSRERGLIRFKPQTEEYEVISLREMLNRQVDDVLCICRARNGDVFVGTTVGLVRLKFDGRRIEAQYMGRKQGLLNDMIHGMLEDVTGFLWLGTNKGLIRYNPANGYSHAYYYSGGVHIGEFSDDAYYKCPYSGRLFFGGIDGLLYIDKSSSNRYEHYPEILLRKLYLGRNKVNIADYYNEDQSALRLKYTENTFTLTFATPDFVSSADIEYSWMLEGYDSEWQQFSVFNEAAYSEVAAGKYIFRVSYRKDIFDTDLKSFSIPLQILPLWYQTILARILFILLGTGLILYIVFIFRRSVRNKRLLNTLLENENKDATENVCLNQEMAAGLSSIYYACDYLRAENTTYEQRSKKVELIRENVMSMLRLSDIFSQVEVRKFSLMHFTVAGRMSLKELSNEVITMLIKNGFDPSGINIEISDTFTFPVYINAFRCFFYYVYLFVSDSRRKNMSIYASEDNGMMMLVFRSQDGNLINKLRESFIGEENSQYVPSRDPDTDFRMRLLHHSALAMVRQLSPVISYSTEGSGTKLSFSFAPAVAEESRTDKKTLLLLEDHDEMCWLVNGILSEQYIIHQVKSIQHAFEFIRQSPSTVFLVDMIMYAHAENTFMEFIRRNGSLLSKTTFIPMLTWNISSSLQRELVLLSDSYIMLPYDIIFLKEKVHKAIYGKKQAKQIYIEELGDFANLVTCTTNEQVEFIRKILTVIEDNIDREDLGSTFIAQQMAMSPRNFYRKFKEISGLAPTELIKNYRMEKAAVLLRDIELSIQDVITEVGITSRSYFYKEFTRKFGVTPKDYRERG